jgi:hypothetical protein
METPRKKIYRVEELTPPLSKLAMLESKKRDIDISVNTSVV